MAEYFSFEDVLGELELGEEDLKRMVSEGELRAFRDENKMKFKQEDVDALKKGRITEPTIILPSTPSTAEGTTDETVLDLDIGQETSALSDTAPPDDLLLEPTADTEPSVPQVGSDDDLLIQTDEVGVEQEETFIEEEADTGLSTEPLQFADESVSETDETMEAPAVEEAVAAGPVRARRPVAGVRARGVGGAVPVAVEEELERKRAHPVWTFFVLLTFIVSAYGAVFFIDQMRMELGQADRPSGLTEGLAVWILEENFWKDNLWTKFHEQELPREIPFGDPDHRIKHWGDELGTTPEGGAASFGSPGPTFHLQKATDNLLDLE